MQVSLFAIDVEDKCFTSGTVYTPDGIQAVNEVFNSCDEVFKFMPTFATFLNVTKVASPYYSPYLRFSDVESLKKMLSFMVGESSDYLTFIPEDVLSTLNVRVFDNRITFEPGHVTVPSSSRYGLPCYFTGSIPAIVTFTKDHVFINNIPVAKLTPDNQIYYCGETYTLNKPIREYGDDAILSLLACYVTLYPGELKWSDVVKLWCGVRIM
jgi:hypothetical protein